MSLDYETAVYLSNVEELALALRCACAETDQIPDERIRRAILVASILTLCQVLDGVDIDGPPMPLRKGGVADHVRDALSKKRRV